MDFGAPFVDKLILHRIDDRQKALQLILINIGKNRRNFFCGQRNVGAVIPEELSQGNAKIFADGKQGIQGRGNGAGSDFVNVVIAFSNIFTKLIFGNPFMHTKRGNAFADKVFIHKRLPFLYIVVLMSIRKTKFSYCFLVYEEKGYFYSLNNLCFYRILSLKISKF